MKNRIIGILCLLLTAAGIAGSLLLWNRPPAGGSVRISQDGKELFRIDLDTAEDALLTVEYEGRTNTIEIKNGHIRVKDAECPDHTCVKMGWLKEDGLPIVCMPNRLVIESDRLPAGLDAVQ